MRQPLHFPHTETCSYSCSTVAAPGTAKQTPVGEEHNLRTGRGQTCAPSLICLAKRARACSPLLMHMYGRIQVGMLPRPTDDRRSMASSAAPLLSNEPVAGSANCDTTAFMSQDGETGSPKQWRSSIVLPEDEAPMTSPTLNSSSKQSSLQSVTRCVSPAMSDAAIWLADASLHEWLSPPFLLVSSPQTALAPPRVNRAKAIQFAHFTGGTSGKPSYGNRVMPSSALELLMPCWWWREEEEEVFITSGNWRGKHNSLSRVAGRQLAVPRLQTSDKP